MSFLPLEIASEYFSYERLVDNGNEFLLRRFSAINEANGITDYFHNQAMKDEKDNSVRNYVVKIRGTEVLIACFTLKSGSIPYIDNAVNLTFSKETKLIPGVELVNIALNDYSLKIIKGLGIKAGRNIFYDIIQPIVKHISQEIGTKVLYLFAVNEKLAEYYKSWGFYSIEDELYNEQLNSSWQNKYSQNCIFMYKPVTEIE
ncbi:MAG: hypothetical protein KIG83_10625 [Treponema sp.]|nr:hypothetical protein [Treponema sp.]